jgi:putative redox protein
MKGTKARLVWKGAGYYVGADDHGRTTVISTQDDTDRVGLRPTDLLLLSLASCTAVDVVTILEKKRQPLSAMEIVAEGTQDDDPPWQFRKVHLIFRLRGSNLTESAARQAIDLAEGKYCSVAASLKPQVAITTDLEILPD